MHFILHICKYIYIYIYMYIQYVHTKYYLIQHTLIMLERTMFLSCLLLL